jgi:hypothetical protein
MIFFLLIVFLLFSFLYFCSFGFFSKKICRCFFSFGFFVMCRYVELGFFFSIKFDFISQFVWGCLIHSTCFSKIIIYFSL